MPREAIKVIADVLSNQMAIPIGQIMLDYERYTIPINNGLYIALAYLGGKPIANNNYFDGNTLIETQSVVMLYQIQIDIMSFDSSARTRKEEVYQSLRSIYAEQAMEANGMQIARIPMGFVDTASLEETKMLNRFTITIQVTALLKKTQSPSYYDTFPTPEVYTNE